MKTIGSDFMKNTFAVIFLVSILLTSCGKSSQTVVLDLSVADDATPVVLRVIDRMQAGEVDCLKFEKGTYHFYPDRAVEKYCYTANHDDHLSRIAFYLKDVKGVTIDGQGSDFVFHNRTYPFLVEDSEDVIFKNFSIDNEERFVVETKVVANNPEEYTVDLAIDPRDKYEIRNDVLYFVKPDYELMLGQTAMYDPELGGVAYNTYNYGFFSGYKPIPMKKKAQFGHKYEMDKQGVYQYIRGREVSQMAEELKQGLVRVTYPRFKAAPPVGMMLVSKGERGFNRLAPAVCVKDTRDFVAENVVVYHAGGMGFLGENSENILLDKCQVTPAEGYMMSTTADATHFVGCRGKVELRDCKFKNQMDDGVNVHGAYQPIVDKVDDYTIGVRMAHSQQKGFVLGRVGDTIAFVCMDKSFDAYEKHVLKQVKRTSGRYMQLVFDEKLPEGLKVGDLAENVCAYPEVAITGCTFWGSYSRGVLISTPRGTLIENCVFHTANQALLFPVENSFWYESGNACDVVVRNNRFENAGFGGASICKSVISFKTDDELSTTIFRNIEITDNVFNHFDSRILEATNIDGLKFERNDINYTGAFPALNPDQPVISFKHCQNVILKDNTYEGKAEKMVGMLDGSDEIVFD